MYPVLNISVFLFQLFCEHFVNLSLMYVYIYEISITFSFLISKKKISTKKRKGTFTFFINFARKMAHCKKIPFLNGLRYYFHIQKCFKPFFFSV
jgi:hypothetical protein